MKSGGTPRAFTTSFTGVGERGIENPARTHLAHVVADAFLDGVVPQVAGVDVVLSEKLGDVALVFLGDAILEFRRGERVLLAVHTGRHQQIDAVGLAPDLRIDPVEFDIEGLGRVSRCAEYPETARIGHRRDHVAAMAEREQRELDAEFVAESGIHGLLPWTALV